MFAIILAFIMRPINFALAKLLRKEISDNNGKEKNIALWSVIFTLLFIALPLLLYYMFIF